MKQEGVKRLSILLGILGVLLMFLVMLGGTNGFSDMQGATWGHVLLVLVGSFLIPFGLVRATGWVIQGFTNK